MQIVININFKHKMSFVQRTFSYIKNYPIAIYLGTGIALYYIHVNAVMRSY